MPPPVQKPEPCEIVPPIIGYTGPGVIMRGALTPLTRKFLAGNGVVPVPLYDFRAWVAPAALHERAMNDLIDFVHKTRRTP